MALADRLTNHVPINACPLGRLIEDLESKPKELAALKVMLGTPDEWGWTAPDIYEALKAEGHTVGFKAINKHRGGKCRCAEDRK